MRTYAMNDQLITIAKYSTATAAHAARIRLDAEGIRAFVADETVASTLWHVGSALGGIKLQVARADAERAGAILGGADSGGGPTEWWLCPDCHQDVDAGFDICWSCGAVYQEVKDRIVSQGKPAEDPSDDQVSESSAPHSAATEEDSTSWRSDFQDEVETPASVAESTPDEVVDRAWRAAVIGLILCPPLPHFYSMWLLAHVAFSDRPLSPHKSSKFYGAWAINVLVAALSLGLIRYLT